MQILDKPSLLAEGSAGAKRNIFKQKPPEADASTSSCCWLYFAQNHALKVSCDSIHADSDTDGGWWWYYLSAVQFVYRTVKLNSFDSNIISFFYMNISLCAISLSRVLSGYSV